MRRRYGGKGKEPLIKVEETPVNIGSLVDLFEDSEIVTHTKPVKQRKVTANAVSKMKRKKNSELKKQAKRREIVREMKVPFKDQPFEDIVEAVENQTTGLCMSIKSLGIEIERIIENARYVGVTTQTAIEGSSEFEKREFHPLLTQIEKKLEQLVKTAETLREHQIAISSKQTAIVKRHAEIEERTAETQNNLILVKATFAALQSQMMVFASQTAFGNPSYITKVHNSGMALIPSVLG